MSDLKGLSEDQLKDMINNAEKALKEKQLNKRKEVIAQIKELAASAGITVDIKEEDGRSSRKGVKVSAKYRNPENPDQTWTGRGVAPKWMQALLNAGREKTEFLI
jgi:DNA-binding protein H-NS